MPHAHWASREIRLAKYGIQHGSTVPKKTISEVILGEMLAPGIMRVLTRGLVIQH